MSSTRTEQILLALVLAGASGCRTNASATPAGEATVCGAICGSMFVVFSATSSAASGLRFSIHSAGDEYPALAFFAALPGTSLEALTYDATNGAAATTVVQETPTGGTTWTQASATAANVGTFSLTITDTGQAVVTDAGTSWPSPQGFLTATLEPVGTLTDAGILLYVSFVYPPNGYCNAGPGGVACMGGF
ncbi:MAG: hypothetical protein ACLPJH_00040 [Myxococcaceae bacterium]